MKCPKCHGKGKCKVPKYDDEFFAVPTEYEESECIICGGNGKVPVEFYEWIQGEMRKNNVESGL